MDKNVMNIYRLLNKKEEKGTLDKRSYEIFCIQVDGDMLKCHPSRMDFGECMKCGCLYCHDWGTDNPKNKYRGQDTQYYYKPKVNQPVKGVLLLTTFA